VPTLGLFVGNAPRYGRAVSMPDKPLNRTCARQPQAVNSLVPDTDNSATGRTCVSNLFKRVERDLVCLVQVNQDATDQIYGETVIVAETGTKLPV